MQGHTRDDCPEPDKCFNCREEGHTTAECPEPEKCRRCRKEGHQVADCPEPMRCNRSLIFNNLLLTGELIGGSEYEQICFVLTKAK